MSITKTLGEDLLRDFNIRAKRAASPQYYATVTGTVPQVGDLVGQDTSTAEAVHRCVASEVPYGLVQSVNQNNGILSIIELNGGVTALFECSGSPALGNQVQALGTATPRGTGTGTNTLISYRDQVKPVASAGAGFIIAIDAATAPGAPVSPSVNHTVMVRFP